MLPNQVPSEIKLRGGAGSVQMAATETAADGKTTLRKFSGTAYTGGVVDLGGWGYPVIVSLAGMTVTKKPRPTLRDHNPSKVIGHSGAAITGSEITVVDGVVSGANEYADEFIQSSDNGFPWQMSIGASAKKVLFLEEDQTTTVNGRKVSGPVYVVQQSVLNEISIVALGADDETSAAVAASAAKSFVGVISMTLDAWLKEQGYDDKSEIPAKALAKLEAQFKTEQAPPPAPPKVEGQATTVKSSSALEEIERMKTEAKARKENEQAILEFARKESESCPMYQGEIAEAAEKAIQAGVSFRDFEVEQIRANRPKSGGMGFVKSSRPGLTDKVMEAALCVTLGLSSAEEKFDDQTLQAAHDRFPHGIGLTQMMYIAASANGYTGDAHSLSVEMQRYAFFGTGQMSVKASGFSTLSLPGILSNTANKVVQENFMAVDQTWRGISAIASVRNFQTKTSYSLTGGLDYEKIGPDGEIKHGTVGETSYTNQADTYAKMLAITRKDMINDDLGAFNTALRRLGRGAALKLNDVFWTEFLNNSTFFSSGNSNVSTGGGSALGTSDGAAINAAEVIFANQTDPDGKPLGAMPAIMLVPTTLKNTAARWMGSQRISNGASSTLPDANVYEGRYRVLSSPYMENSSYTGYSTAAWYLLANPSDLAVIEVCFLNGREAPVVESADAEFNQLGIQMRGYHDFGVNLQEYRAGVRSAGS